jgi:hypothetical protein
MNIKRLIKIYQKIAYCIAVKAKLQYELLRSGYLIQKVGRKELSQV